MAKDDYIRVHWKSAGTHNIIMASIGLSWPPPEYLLWDAEDNVFREPNEFDDERLILKRMRMSSITDEQMEKCPGVCRGAEYRYEANLQTVH